MVADQLRRAIAQSPREGLASIATAVWQAYAAGAITEGEAQGLAEAVEARKAIRATPAQRKQAGSRPRSPESLERRRRWASAGMMPPTIACRFTQGESAALAVIATEVRRQGACKLTVGGIAGRAGVSETTVRNAVREAVALGLVTSQEWRLSAFRSAPNTVRIVSREWHSWLAIGGRVQITGAHEYLTSKIGAKMPVTTTESPRRNRSISDCARRGLAIPLRRTQNIRDDA